MIENLIIVSSAEQARHRYQLKTGKQCVPIKSPSLVSGEDLGWVVTSKEAKTLQAMRFGFTSHRDCLQAELQFIKIPQKRKELLVILVALRFEKLMHYLA